MPCVALCRRLSYGIILWRRYYIHNTYHVHYHYNLPSSNYHMQVQFSFSFLFLLLITWIDIRTVDT